MSATTTPTRPLQDWFSGLDRSDQLRFLLSVSRELTVVARCFYVPQADGFTESGPVRDVNEIQHRVLAHAADILDDPAAAAHPVAYGWLSDVSERGGLSRLVAEAVSRAESWVSRSGEE